MVERMKIAFLRAYICFLAAVLAAAAALHAQTPLSAPVSIQVHAGQPIGPYTPIWNYFGADEPNYLYAPNGKKLLAELAALSPVPVYFRPHNLFTTGSGDGALKWGSTNVYTERPDGTPVYDFTITDRIFDALTQAHVRPLVEIGFMPEALSSHPEPQLSPGRHLHRLGISAQRRSQVVQAGCGLRGPLARALRQPNRNLALGGVERARYKLLARHSSPV
jgi:hypothetical protein